MNLNKIKAIILGHAIGDALGVPVEFAPREVLDNKPVTDMLGFGTYDVPEGSWSDDTSMTLCALDSLSSGNFDPDDIMDRFAKWYYDGEYTPTGETFDVGNTCSNAIVNYIENKMSTSECGLSDERSNGNGSLMRIIPFVLYSYFNTSCREKTIEIGSKLTHAHLRSVLACQIYSNILLEMIDNPTKDAIRIGYQKSRELYGKSDEWKYFEGIEFLKDRERDSIKSTGYVVDSIYASLWCVLKTNSYKECVLMAVNLGGDTDTIAAIAGGIAGALYGLEAIPKNWIDKLKRRDYIEELCSNAYNAWSGDTGFYLYDIHTHIIPYFDDGASNMDKAKQMLEKSYSQGVRKIFCTSHAWQTLEEREDYLRYFNELNDIAYSNFDGLRLYTGCEIYCEEENIDHIIFLLESKVLLTMNDSKCVLVEFYPDVEYDEVDMITDKLIRHGFSPIVAHVERYWELKLSDVIKLKNKGCMIQLNLCSLTNNKDIKSREIANDYLHSGLIDFVGSDAHGMNHKPPEVTKGLEIIKNIYKDNIDKYYEISSSNIKIITNDS